jgi:hypothetical protein
LFHGQLADRGAIWSQCDARLHPDPEGVIELDSALAERLKKFRMRHDASTASRQTLRRALIHFNVPTGTPEQIGDEETAERSTNDAGRSNAINHLNSL